jgi:carboxymethylenebutenolidase
MNELPKITQEMIDLYDEFTHVTLDKSAYLTRLTDLVGSAELANALTMRIAANMSAAGLVAENDSRLKTQSVTFGDQMTGYLAMPANATGKLPAVMVVHENRGLVPHIKDLVRRVALEGFLAFGPDFLAPDGGTPADEDVGRDMIGKLDRAKTVKNAVDAVKFLQTHPNSTGKVGAIGFCWGGGIVNATAVAAGDMLKAAAPYYGAQPKAEDVPKIKAEMMLHYAGSDERINAGIPAYKEALEKNGVKHQIFIYDGAQHAFNNDTSEARYDAKAAELAWSRSMELFKRALG